MPENEIEKEIEKETKEFKLNEDQQTEYDTLENDEDKSVFYDKLKLDWETKNADLDAEKKLGKKGDQEPETYKSFKNKDDFTNFIKEKTKNYSLKNKKLSDENLKLKDELKNLKLKIETGKRKIRVITINNKKPKPKTIIKKGLA